MSGAERGDAAGVIKSTGSRRSGLRSGAERTGQVFPGGAERSGTASAAWLGDAERCCAERAALPGWAARSGYGAECVRRGEGAGRRGASPPVRTGQRLQEQRGAGATQGPGAACAAAAR